MSPGLAAIGGVAVALIATAGDAMAQASGSTVGPGARVRITISATPTPGEIVAMVGAEEGFAGVPAGSRTFSVRTRDNRKLVLPAPGARFDGVLLTVDEQLLSMENDGVPTALTVPRRAIGKLERAAGRRSRARYAGFGALAGMGVGAIVSQASIDCSKTWCLALPALPGAILGSGIGAVIGAIVPPAVRWSTVDVASLSNVPEVHEVPPTPPAGPRTPPRLAMAFQLGVASNGPAEAIEQAMRTNGFADTSSGFGRSVAHPSSELGFLPTMFEFNYAVRAPWYVGFVVSRAPIGETVGYRAAGAQYLAVEYEVITAGAVLSWHNGPFRVGAGPALHTARARQATGSFNALWVGESRLGFIALAGARLPTDTRVYLDLTLQYRDVGSTSIGPFTTLVFSGPGATLPALEAPFSHWIVGFGPGIRF